MSIAAFTNEVGYHSMNSIVSGSITDHNYDQGSAPGNPVYNIVTYEQFWALPIAYSNKPPIYKSPGHAPSYYWRYVGEVRTNRPWIQSTKVWNNFGQYYETWRDTSYPIAPRGFEPFTWTPFSNKSDTDVINRSVVNALLKIQDLDFSEDGTTQFQGGNALAEARETGRMLAKSAIKLVKVIKAARGGHWTTVLDTLGISKRTFIPNKTVSETWLEIQYGWKPLLKDIHDLDQTVRHLLSRDHQIRVSAGAIETKSPPPFGDWRYKGTYVSVEKCKTTFLATLTNRYAAELQSMGVINPLGIAWELLPFSFVVDWFIPISKTLEALTSTAGFRNDGGWSSVHQEFLLNIVRNEPESGGTLLDPGQYQEAGFGFIRFAYAEWPQTRLFTNPTPWSTPHALNALALMSQLGK